MPERQTTDHFRYVLGSWGQLLKFIHTLDEPADIMKEMGIFLPPEQRRALWPLIHDGEHRDSAAVADRVTQIYEETSEHELDLDISVNRILSGLEHRAKSAHGFRRYYAILKATIELCKSGNFLDWSALEREIVRHNIHVDWDYIVVGATFIHNGYEKEVALVTSYGVQGWLSGDTGFVR